MADWLLLAGPSDPGRGAMPSHILTDQLTLSHLGDRLCPSHYYSTPPSRGFQTFLRPCFLYVHIKTSSRRFARSYRFLMGSPLWFLYRPHCYAKICCKNSCCRSSLRTLFFMHVQYVQLAIQFGVSRSNEYLLAFNLATLHKVAIR